MATAYRPIEKPAAETGGDAALLCARIATLARDLPALSLDRLSQRVEEVRGAARRHGLTAVAGIAAELTDAIARDGRAALIRPYLDALREACGCAPDDDNAVHALLASISVRFAG